MKTRIGCHTPPKSGIPAPSTRDRPLLREAKRLRESTETVAAGRKGRHTWAFPLGRLGSLGYGKLPGWRRGVDRTGLHFISLRTGNFTGNVAISGSPSTGFGARNRCVAAGFYQIPYGTNRVIFRATGNFSARSRNFSGRWVSVLRASISVGR